MKTSREQIVLVTEFGDLRAIHTSWLGISFARTDPFVWIVEVMWDVHSCLMSAFPLFKHTLCGALGLRKNPSETLTNAYAAWMETDLLEPTLQQFKFRRWWWKAADLHLSSCCFDLRWRVVTGVLFHQKCSLWFLWSFQWSRSFSLHKLLLLILVIKCDGKDQLITIYSLVQIFCLGHWLQGKRPS